MVRYFFDIQDGDRLSRDTDGLECEGRAAIRGKVMCALPEIARDAAHAVRDHHAFTISVRDESDVTVYTATLVMAGQWLGEDRSPPDVADSSLAAR